MTRIAIHTLGTRGDVQPFVALGRGLQNAGIDVSFATAPQFKPLVCAHDLPFHALPGDLVDLVHTPLAHAAMSGHHKLLASFRLMAGLGPLFRSLLDAQWDAAQDADAIVYHPKAIGGVHIAEKLGIPAFVALPLPALSATGAFPSPLLPFSDLGPLNRASHALVIRYGDLPFRRTVARWREQVLGLPPKSDWLTLRGRSIAKLYPYSPAVVPVANDWDNTAHVTGYWFLDDVGGWTPPPELAAFLQAGPPPVYVGFGSLPSPDAERITAVIIDALTRAGQRGILATGWGGMAMRRTPEHIHMLNEAPHAWLFSRMAAVVHHGGAGTTAAGLRAGRPSVICPIFGDQPFWGRAVHRLGAGPAPIPHRELTPERLATAISRAVNDPIMRRRASGIARIIQQEDGVAEAVGLIKAQGVF
ncbi:glycosyltransferase family 1 protein [Bradyrhizobium sp. 83012]|uniref:Glycosyltransferase family 1 protein n=1 Tax=Bradyrhizobium aeschynomenes TaxID=2734909 RepID=A0ABX2C8E5_9BRAD|nr:glycosyltransferase [Bradyrhizobium aeschynomenes]NPU63637.1 glycosyltransferase family 1 protein [Bradyrhizobium aeschynomenes]